jgi:hypothetical protein
VVLVAKLEQFTCFAVTGLLGWIKEIEAFGGNDPIEVSHLTTRGDASSGKAGRPPAGKEASGWLTGSATTNVIARTARAVA